MAKHYDKDFKLNALQYRKDHPELNIAAVCRNLGITASSYYKWAQEFETINTIEVRGSGNYSNDFKQQIYELYNSGQSVAKLSSEYGIPGATIYKWIRELEMENEILKKATHHFD